jgi:hypothetical protein
MSRKLLWMRKQIPVLAKYPELVNLALQFYMLTTILLVFSNDVTSFYYFEFKLFFGFVDESDQSVIEPFASTNHAK